VPGRKGPGTLRTTTDDATNVTAERNPTGRVPYRDAGDAIRATLRAAMRADLAPLEHRVVEAAVVLIGTYSRTCDEIGTRQIAAEVYGVDRDDVTGYQRRRVSNALVTVARAGVLEYRPGRGRGARPTIAIGGAATTPLEAEKVSPSDHLSEQKGGAPARERWRGTARKVSRRVGHTEKNSEKTPEKSSLRARTRTRARDVEVVDAADVEIVDAAPASNRRRDPLFDAVTDALRIEPTALTKSGRGALNRALAELRAVNADPAEVPIRAEMYRARFNGVALTATALAKHWAELGPDARNLPGSFGVLAQVVAERQRRQR
jgi:hypothetical protein